MIISASRRTDIPAFYSDWFFNRIKEQYVLVRNPRNFRRISRVLLSPDVVDGIVFWTKNPAPMLAKLDALRDYTFYFQFTLTPYARDVEPGIGSKDDSIIPAFQRLADTLGPARVVWRYDPVLLSDVYTETYHLKHFEKLAGRLSGYTDRCTISFLDMYRNTRRNAGALGIRPLTENQMACIAQAFAGIAGRYGIKVDACGESLDLTPYGVGQARCVDARLFERLLGRRLSIEKAKHQRPACGCAQSVDIGMYNTCPAGCKYCYANYNAGVVADNHSRHDPDSPLLVGRPTDQDIVKDRKAISNKSGQLQLFGDE